MKHQGIYDHLIDIEREDCKQSFSVTHLNDSVYQELNKEGEILFMNSAAAYIRNEELGKGGKKKADNRGNFPCRPFYESARSMYDICCQLHEQYSTRTRINFQEFLRLEIYLTPSNNVTIQNIVISQMMLISYSSQNERENQTNNKRRESTLTRKMTAHVPSLNIPCTSSVVAYTPEETGVSTVFMVTVVITNRETRPCEPSNASAEKGLGSE